ncbi:hypothetical protein GZ78_25035 [Endozoicomonas numazuensis]|uniref:Uncharacterized protein n=1 Tax=Endozoicomonas numazuensis TaxID=1137799 RepID=A0A081N9J7_9GAMM|nr:hypothetical protein GZ78_25035 [Endozoicomonas numazuensis]
MGKAGTGYLHNQRAQEAITHDIQCKTISGNTKHGFFYKEGESTLFMLAECLCLCGSIGSHQPLHIATGQW